MTLLPEIRGQLIEAISAQSAAGSDHGVGASARSPRLWLYRLGRTTPGGVALAVGVVLALAVAVGAIVAVGHRGSERHRVAAPVRSDPARALLSALSVLRRPQTTADKSLPNAVARHLSTTFGPDVQVVPRLTRLVATLRGNGLSGRDVRVYFVVVTSGAGRADKMVEIMWRGMGGGIGPPLSALQLYRPPSAIPGVGVVSATGRAYYWSSVVPDGVSRVRWVFKTRATRIAPAKPVAVYPSIRNNLATAPAGIHPTTSAVDVTWYGRRGDVLASFHYRGY